MLFSICLNSRAKTLSIKNTKEMEFNVKTEVDGVSLVSFLLWAVTNHFCDSDGFKISLKADKL